MTDERLALIRKRYEAEHRHLKNQDVPDLIAEVERLRRERDAMQAQIEHQAETIAKVVEDRERLRAQVRELEATKSPLTNKQDVAETADRLARRMGARFVLDKS